MWMGWTEPVLLSVQRVRPGGSRRPGEGPLSRAPSPRGGGSRTPPPRSSCLAFPEQGSTPTRSPSSALGAPAPRPRSPDPRPGHAGRRRPLHGPARARRALSTELRPRGVHALPRRGITELSPGGRRDRDGDRSVTAAEPLHVCQARRNSRRPAPAAPRRGSQRTPTRQSHEKQNRPLNPGGFHHLERGGSVLRDRVEDVAAADGDAVRRTVPLHEFLQQQRRAGARRTRPSQSTSWSSVSTRTYPRPPRRRLRDQRENTACEGEGALRIGGKAVRRAGSRCPGHLLHVRLVPEPRLCRVHPADPQALSHTRPSAPGVARGSRSGVDSPPAPARPRARLARGHPRRVRPGSVRSR